MLSRFIVLLYSLLLLLPAKGIACSCAIPPPLQAYTNAAVVFSGKVENIQYLDNPEKTKHEARIIVTFSVYKIWKGEKQKKIILHTVENAYSCNGYHFESGKEYLVYAKQNKRADNWLAKLFAPDKPRLGIYLCGGTKPLSMAGEDLEYLNEKN